MQLETQNSVSRIRSEREETYLCSSSVQYVKPVRAINSRGEWRIVLNYLKAKNDFIAQTVRIELCDHPGEKCPKIPGKKIYFGKFILKIHFRKIITDSNVRHMC